MALTLPRWIALGVAGCLIAIVAVLREPADRPSNEIFSPEKLRAQLAADHARGSAKLLRALMLRDSVLRSIERATSAGNRYVISAALAGERLGLERVVDTLRANRPVMPAVPIDVAFIPDMGADVRGVPSVWPYGRYGITYVLPDQGPNGRCLVIARMRPGRGVSWVSNDDRRRRFFGPCAFFKAFGHPGAAVSGWLQRHDWSFALYGDWSAPYPAWTDPWFSSRSYRGSHHGLRRWASGDGFACASGERDRCRKAVLEEPAPNRQLMRAGNAWGNVVDPNQVVIDRPIWGRHTTLGTRETILLADMARTLGPDRFREFWRSNAGVAEAFHAASGKDIGEWTHEWAVSTYGPQTRGPGMSRGSAAWGLAFAGSMVLVAGAAARRRQVS